MAKRVGILTGGGDVPGLNAAIQQFVWRMEEEGYEVLGLRRGWAALLNVKPYHDADNSAWLVPLTRASTRTIDRSGGTILHSSRINPALTKPERRARAPAGPTNKVLPDGRLDLTDAALDVLRYLHLDTLVAIGGDGTLSFARRLHLEGVKIIGLPKTMDNDVYGTDYCIGFSTAITRSVNFINDLRTVAGSHERFLVVELFGRYSGETCLLASYLAGTDRALIAEVPFDLERVVGMLAEDKRTNPSNYAVCADLRGGLSRWWAALRDRRGRRRGQPRARRRRPLPARSPAEGDWRPGDLSAPGLPDALRPARLPRPPGRQELRQPRRGPRSSPARRAASSPSRTAATRPSPWTSWAKARSG